MHLYSTDDSVLEHTRQASGCEAKSIKKHPQSSETAPSAFRSSAINDGKDVMAAKGSRERALMDGLMTRAGSRC